MRFFMHFTWHASNQSCAARLCLCVPVWMANLAWRVRTGRLAGSFLKTRIATLRLTSIREKSLFLHTAWPIPARIDSLPLTSGRVLFVGDAAAATDVMTGEGIGQALLTGRLAAGAIIAGGATRPDDVAHRYERAVRHHLVADHRMSTALGKVLATPWGARGAIRVVAASGTWGRRNFARWMFEDEPRAVAITPSRWHRGLLGRPGAYCDE